MGMEIGVMFLKKRRLISIIIVLFFTIFSNNYLYANGENIMNNKELIAHAKKILKKGGITNIENYETTISSVTTSINDANYVVRFTPKRKSNEPPMVGGSYSVYFKQENNEFKFIEVVIEQ